MSFNDTLRRLGFGIEDAEDELALSRDVEEPENLDEATELESELIEAQERQEELDNLERDAETAADAMEAFSLTILNTQLALESETGGLSPWHARQYNITKKYVHRTMGVPYSGDTFISASSMEDHSSRAELTRISLEEDKSSFKDWWEKIKAFFKAAVTKSVDAIVGLFSAVKAVESRAIQINKECQDKDASFDGKMSKEQLKKYGKRFCLPTSDDKATVKLKDVFDVLHESVNFGTKDIPSLTKNMKFFNNFQADGRAGAKEYNQAWENIEKEIKPGMLSLPVERFEKKVLEAKASKMRDEDNEGENVSLKILHGSFDGHYLFAIRTLGIETQEDGLAEKGSTTGAFKMEFKFDQVIDVPESESLSFPENDLTADSCKRLVKEVASMATSMRKVQENIKSFTEAFNDFVKNVDSKTRGIGEEIIGALKRFINAIKGFFTASNGFNKWFKYTLSVMRDALNLVSIRLSGSKGESSDKDDDKEKKEK